MSKKNSEFEVQSQYTCFPNVIKTKTSIPLNHQKGLTKHGLLGPTPGVFDTVGVGEGPRIHSSDQELLVLLVLWAWGSHLPNFHFKESSD